MLKNTLNRLLIKCDRVTFFNATCTLINATCTFKMQPSTHLNATRYTFKRYFSHYTCAQNAKYRKMCGSGPLSSRCARARVGLRCVIHVLLRSDTRGPFFSLSKRRRLSDCTSDCDKSREASSELRDARGRCSEQRSFARRQLRPSVQCWVRYDG